MNEEKEINKSWPHPGDTQHPGLRDLPLPPELGKPSTSPPDVKPKQ
jgi:hypothetical protein